MKGNAIDDFGQGITHRGMSGLGMTVDEARTLLIYGTGTPEQLAQANQIYYTAYNAYVRKTNPADDPNSVISNTQIVQNSDGTYSAVSTDPLPNGSLVSVPPYPGNYADQPTLLSMEDCSPTDSACVARNNQREQDNQILRNNANNLYNRKICEYNWALNWNAGNHSSANNCGQYAQSNLPYDPSTLIAKDANGIPISTNGTVADSISDVVSKTGKTLADIVASLTGQPLHAAAATVDANGNVVPGGIAGMDSSSLMWLGIAGIAALVFVTSK